MPPFDDSPAGNSSAALQRLLQMMAKLRDPDGGCPWDLRQDFATIAPYTIEEAYEVADAIERGDMHDLKDELGDLLFQVVFHARMAEERGDFTFTDVVTAIADKMEARHPHVFAGGTLEDERAVNQWWEQRKESERAAKAAAAGRRASTLDGVAAGLPALTRALKLQKRAARVGFDWSDAPPILDKLEEELRELRAELAAGDTRRIEDELGDVLFVVVNLARHLKIDPEAALRGTNGKFERRFRFIEDRLAAEGRRPDGATLDEMEMLWQRAKTEA
ncbi:MAG: MazG family protein [Rhodospirillales bacterium]|nr:MazG family protein [Rhodospirillales bacterium]